MAFSSQLLNINDVICNFVGVRDPQHLKAMKADRGEKGDKVNHFQCVFNVKCFAYYG